MNYTGMVLFGLGFIAGIAFILLLVIYSGPTKRR